MTIIDLFLKPRNENYPGEDLVYKDVDGDPILCPSYLEEFGFEGEPEHLQVELSREDLDRGFFFQIIWDGEDPFGKRQYFWKKEDFGWGTGSIYAYAEKYLTPLYPELEKWTRAALWVRITEIND